MITTNEFELDLSESSKAAMAYDKESYRAGAIFMAEKILELAHCNHSIVAHVSEPDIKALLKQAQEIKYSEDY